MLSESYTRKAGIFDADSVSGLLSKIEKSGVASEVDNMVLTSVISTHLLHHQFIENNNTEFQPPPLKNMKIVEDIIINNEKFPLLDKEGWTPPTGGGRGGKITYKLKQ